MDLLQQSNLPLAAVSEGKEIGWYIFFYSGLTIALVLLFAALAKKGLKSRVYTYLPTRLAEHLYLFLEGMTVNVIGPQGKKYVPFLLALWTFIFVGNVMGLLLAATPTADWSLNIAMAIITVVYVQYEGIKQNGVWGHIKHFSGPKLGGAMIIVSGLIFVVEIVSECMKLVSLSLRLYGNIEGGHIVRTSLDSIIAGIPIGGVLLPIKFFTCIIQAFVWSILTCTYLSIATAHGHDEEHEESHADHGHHSAIAEAAHA
jgi:F-type H+-transporting ATPase subunit a